MSKKYEVEITGVAPLLMHKFQIEEHSEGSSKRKKKVHDAKEDVEKALYRNKNGKIFIPGEWIYAALIKQGSKQKFDGRTSYKDTFKSTIVIEPDEIILNNQKYEIDIRPVVIPSTRGRIVRYRPKFEKWNATFELNVLEEDLISSQVLKEALDDAGQSGIGDYRPRFGRFMVSKFKEVI